MNNEQLAHDLAVVRMAGKQLPAQELIEEYRKNYAEILKCLNSETNSTCETKTFRSPF